MKNFIDRRLWLKQSTLALAALGLTPTLFAKDSKKTFNNYKEFHSPGSTILLNSNENAYGPSPWRERQYWKIILPLTVTLMT